MRKVLRIPLSRPNLGNAKTVVPEGKAVIERIVPAARLLYVQDITGGPSQVRIFDTEGRAQGLVPVKPVSAVRQVLPLRNADRDHRLYMLRKLGKVPTD